MKHFKLMIALLWAFLMLVPQLTEARSKVRVRMVMTDVTTYAGISPLPQEMKQGGIAFRTPIPSYVKIIKGVAGKRAVKKYADKIPTQKEGYYLHIGKKEIVLAGRDEAGLFYAEQTLSQILAKEGSVIETEIRDWPEVECRGVIEGFYGNPWSHEDRLRQFEFYGKNKMNTYVYGPKDDPYHRRHWRVPYPEKEASLLRELAEVAKKNHVKFVWAVHPGIDIKWNLEDSLAIVKKLESVYSLGVRSFAVFFDDIGGEGTKADKQAGLMNYITKQFVKKHKDVEPLMLCPTQYNKSWSSGDYLSILGKQMDKDIRIMWTGNSVVDMIERGDMEWINGQIGRKAFIWLNYPVNDYCQSRLLMGKTYGNGRDIGPMLSGFCSNPMEYAETSKVSLYSIADYSWNMKYYNAEQSWERTIKYLMPTCAEAFKVFCENNIDLGVTGHGLRREGESMNFRPFLEVLSKEAPKTPKYASFELQKNAGYESTLRLCNTLDMNKLGEELNTLIWASQALLKDSVNHPHMIREIQPWVEAMHLSGVRGKYLIEEANHLLNRSDDKFIFSYNGMHKEELKQKTLRSRDYEGSIVKAQPAFSGDVVTPLLKQLSDTLIALYKMQYKEHWDVFPHGVLPDGDYYIVYKGKLLTDSLASPVQTGDFPVFQAERDVINPQRQLWHFVYNEKLECYSITNVQDGRYINEIGNFWRDMEKNPFDLLYHSFSIEEQNKYFSIRQTGKGGSSYWQSNGRRITTGNTSNNFVFQIVPKDEMK